MARIPQDRPSHVPGERVVDIDIYRMPGGEQDLHRAWKDVQDGWTFGLLWTPRNGGHWIVTRGREIARIYADHENFSSNITIVPREWGEKFPLRPTTLDPPAHRPFRRLINAALTRGVVRSAEPTIRTLAASAIERVRPRGRCEFVVEVAEPLPLGVFMHLANLPPESASVLPRYGEEPDATSVPVMDRFANFLRPFVAERQKEPGDDLLSHLVCGEVDGRPIDEEEAVEVSTAMLTGGLDTVVSSLAIMMAFLARNRAHRERLADEPAVTRPAVDELLRRFPIMTKARLVKHDQRIEGVRLNAGDMIVLPPLHGLDGREFDHPLTVDFDRSSAPNSTFGNGVHHCPGSLLARTELTLALQEWFRRIPEFEIDPRRPPRMRTGILGAMVELGLHWDPATTRAVSDDSAAPAIEWTSSVSGDG